MKSLSNDEKLVQQAIKMAKEENRTIGLYRNESGELSIAIGPNYPIERIITPLYQNFKA